MDVGAFNGRRLYTGLTLDYRLRLRAPTAASRAISGVAELLVSFGCTAGLDLRYSDLGLSLSSALALAWWQWPWPWLRSLTLDLGLNTRDGNRTQQWRFWFCSVWSLLSFGFGLSSAHSQCGFGSVRPVHGLGSINVQVIRGLRLWIWFSHIARSLMHWRKPIQRM